MEFFGKKTQIDFMGHKLAAAIISIVIGIGSLFFLAVNGLNWGLEFTGGTEVQLSFTSPPDIPSIRQKLVDAGFKDVSAQIYGASTSILVRFAGKQDLKNKVIGKEIAELIPQATVRSESYIGPQVGKELALNGALALIVAMLGTAVYIAFRFEYRFAISAAVALLHDPIIILGFFAATQMEFDLISLAAILTIIGYSLNDTIVVFDRVRENFRKLRNGSAAEVINLSVNQTLSRTMMTSGLTLLAVLALFFFGGEVLHGFSAALLIGIIVGTYSSIYIAGTLAVQMGLSRKDMLGVSKDMLDERP